MGSAITSEMHLFQCECLQSSVHKFTKFTCSASTPATPQGHRLQTRPSMIHIQIDRTCDADLEQSGGLESKSPEFITLNSTDAETVQFPHTDNGSPDDASDASVELGAVHLSRLSSPLDAAGSPVKPTLQ